MPGRILYVVCLKVGTQFEKEWNDWNDKVHIPMVLAQPGFIQVRKFRSLSSTSKEAEYFVLYELRNQAAYDRYVKSDEAEVLRQHYLDEYGAKTKIVRWVWQETFSMTKT
jgi:hypothetical protein